mgnify:CR=1 FL=1
MATPADAFARAVQRAALQRQSALLTGIQRYRHHPYARDVSDPPPIWRDGASCLHDYGAVPEAADPGGPPLLCVPSLINRAYVLDLKSDASFLRFLAAAGWRPLLLDWGAPGQAERGFDLTAYVAGRLEAALDVAADLADGPVPVLGYCMGGTLALALAQRRPRDVAALALLAAPWDFHAGQAAQAAVMARTCHLLEPVLQTLGELPTDHIQALFAGLDPQTAVRKFLAFARMDPASPRAAAFVALEDWLNDGVPLAAPVARTCMGEWYGQNTPANGEWRIAGRAVLPREVRCPSLAVVPEADRIVPPASARAVTATLPDSQVWTPAVGHIGMMAGKRARTAVWAPLVRWLNARVVQRT